jgi:predicted amidohydrolase YtcJ
VEGTLNRTVLAGGKVVTLDAGDRIAEAVLIEDDRVAATGTAREMRDRAGAGCREIDLAGRTVIPGLVDAHAHLDREGLKHLFPSLAGAATTEAVLARIAALATSARPGEWIVTMPLGSPPQYRDAPPPPTRYELDRAAPDNPVYIRPIWGYWRDAPGAETLISAANSRALALAGVTRDTKAPSPAVTIGRDADGEPTGVFEERTAASVVELVLFRMAKRFTPAQRRDGLARAMAIYNATGTTAVQEAHGVADEVMEVWRAAHAEARLTVRAHLMHSPQWSRIDPGARAAAVAGFTARDGDAWLRIGGMFLEVGGVADHLARASVAPYTSWAGFHYDCGLPRGELPEVLVAAARVGVQVSGLTSSFLPLYEAAAREAPIAGLRWLAQHLGKASTGEIATFARLGVGITPLTNRYIDKEGNAPGNRFANPSDGTFMPLKSLIASGVRVGLETDNAPPSLWHAIGHVVARRDRFGRDVAPMSEKLSRVEALRAATLGSASLSFREREIGSLEPGKLADLAVLSDDPLICDEDALPAIVSELTMVGGRIVYER